MPSIPVIKGPDADAAYAAAQKVVETHQHLSKWIRPGMTLAQIDAEVARFLESINCRSCFYGYKVPKSPPFPSHACLSVNDCVVHGTAGYRREPLKQGDLLKVDIGVWHGRPNAWIGDAAWTYAVGEPTPAARRLMECGKESLARGVRELRPGNTYLAWARAVQNHVEKECGFFCVRGLGGHGIGRALHTPPYVANVVPTYNGEWPEASKACTPGTLIAVEPMIAVGTGDTYHNSLGRLDDWPVFTKDGSLSVHYEHDILITENGPRNLTEGLETIRDVIE